MALPNSQKVIFTEDFSSGLEAGEQWQLLAMGDFAADDGIATKTDSGISIAPPARNAETGEPMFVKRGPAVLGHLKFLANSTQAFSTADGPLRFSFRARATCFGTSKHPYGAEAVPDSDADVRLGAGTLIVTDPQTGMVFDFWLGQTSVYPIYERLQYPGTTWEAFTQVPARIPREPGAVQEFAITVDGAANTVVWEIDGQVVAQIDRIGPSAPDWHTVLGHGGEPTDVIPGQVSFGLGLMTLLDGSLPPSSKGLVDPGGHLAHPTEFAGGPDLFGQGVALEVQRVVVEQG